MSTDIQISPSLQAFIQALQAPVPLYLVGGGVRNALLGLPEGDYDLTGPLPPKEILHLSKRAGFPAVLRSSKMGTVEIRLCGNIIEYTPFRIESYPPGGGHHPARVVFTQSMEQDALRRDFTVNALYADLATGRVLDPVNGLADLAGRRLSTCRPSAVETLRDDGLRLLRMARFAGELGFEIAPDLMQAAQRFAPQIHAISAPRIWAECSKIVLADVKYQTPGGHARAMQALEVSGVLYQLIPELKEGKGVTQNQIYHAFDVLGHNLAAYSASLPEAALRWSALLHDVGKPRAKDETGRMIGHDAIGAAMSAEILTRLGADNHTVRLVHDLIARHMFDLNGSAKLNTVRKHFAVWGFPFAEQLIALRRSDIAGSGRPLVDMDTAGKWEQILTQMRSQGCIDDIRQLRISGAEIMQACQLSPSPMVGRIKQALFEQCAMDPEKNDPRWLVSMAPKVYSQLEQRR